MAIEDRNYMREGDDSPKRPELRPDIPWHSASRLSDEEYRGWLIQKVDRPWFTIVMTVLLSIVGLYMMSDDVMREFVNSFLGR